MEVLELGMLAVVLGGALSVVAYTLRLGIGPSPSSRRARQAMLTFIPPDTEGPIVELGAGWGGLVVALAAHAPRATIVAYEASPLPFAVTWLRVRLLGRPRVVVRRADFFEASLSGAGYVTCYLFTGAMARLQPKLEAELSPGAHVLSNTFGLRGWTPVGEVQLDDLFRTRVFDYCR